MKVNWAFVGASPPIVLSFYEIITSHCVVECSGEMKRLFRIMVVVTSFIMNKSRQVTLCTYKPLKDEGLQPYVENITRLSVVLQFKLSTIGDLMHH